MTKSLDILTPPWALPLLRPARYKGAWGGRGSGKSHAFAEMVIEAHVMDPSRRTVCVREVQKSLDQSVKRLLEDKIKALGVERYFDVQKTTILSAKGDGRITFVGMQDHTAESVKSLEGYDCAWVEEAQSLSHHSMRLLRPTIRKPGSELWFTWNPRFSDDAVDELLRGKDKPPGAIVVKVNSEDNPWFPDVLRAEREFDRQRDPARFEHVWQGGYDAGGEGRVYSRFSREVHCGTPCVPPRAGTLQLACDFNYGEMHWLLCEVNKETARVHVLKEIVGHYTTTDAQAEDAAEVIRALMQERVGGRDIIDRKRVRDMRIQAFCDATAESKWSVVPLTHVSLILQAGFKPMHGAANPKVKERVDTVQVMLRDRRLTVDPGCTRLIRALEQQSYVDGKPDKSNNIDHGVDALGYLCHWQFGVKQPKKDETPEPQRTSSIDVDDWGPVL